jgi:hypothetical protein
VTTREGGGGREGEREREREREREEERATPFFGAFAFEVFCFLLALQNWVMGETAVQRQEQV